MLANLSTKLSKPALSNFILEVLRVVIPWKLIWFWIQNGMIRCYGENPIYRANMHYTEFIKFLVIGELLGLPITLYVICKGLYERYNTKYALGLSSEDGAAYLERIDSSKELRIVVFLCAIGTELIKILLLLYSNWEILWAI